MKPINKPSQSRQELEALIDDALEGRLDSEALEALRRSLEDHPDLKNDLETLHLLKPLQDHQMMTVLDHAFPTQAFEDPFFETSLRNSWQKQTSGQDLYYITYILFKRYALAASLTILGGLSLLQFQSNSQTERSLELSQAELSQSEISEFLYGSDESLSTSYYASLFDADLDGEGATSTGSNWNTGAGTSGSGNVGTGNPGVGNPTTGNPTNTSNTDKN